MTLELIDGAMICVELYFTFILPARFIGYIDCHLITKLNYVSLMSMRMASVKP